jgi:large subunit ribosomal protein L30
MKPHLKVTQTKSTIGQHHGMRTTLRGLGLRGPGTTVLVGNTPSFRGAVKKVLHLVTVEEVDHG